MILRKLNTIIWYCAFYPCYCSSSRQLLASYCMTDS